MDLDEVAAEIVQIPGVVGVFRGLRRRRKQWTDEKVLSVHVRRKKRKSDLKKRHRIADRFPGVPIDIVAVGRPRLHAEVDSDDQLVAAYDDTQRRSAVSALARDGDGKVLGLGSGHGLLPLGDGNYQSGAWDPTGKSVYVFSDPDDTSGGLLFGAIGESVDFAVVKFQNLQPPTALLGHTLSHLPIPLRHGEVALGESVQHEVPRRGRIVGSVRGVRSQTPIGLRSEDGFDLTYADLITVTGSYVSFSRPGDSGSLVFDSNRNAVGFVVGGGKDPDDSELAVSYVLCNFDALKTQMGETFSSFFGG